MDEVETDVLNAGRGGVIAARGTGDGLVLRLDGRVEPAVLRGAMIDFMSARRGFLSGNEVALEWVGKLPEDEFVDELKQELTKEFDITVRASKLRETPSFGGDSSGSKDGDEDDGEETPAADEDRNLSLFDGIEAMGLRKKSEQPVVVPKAPVERKEILVDPGLWDEADARLVCTTLRSGQRLETEHSVVIMGDVNSGAEVIAGGDIAVLGTLRGVAHAGAYDETGGGRVIFALNLQPTQLRVGSIISRGGEDTARKVPEIARVEDGIIVVEAYHSRAWNRGRS